MIYNLIILLPTAVSLFGAAWLICKKDSNTRSQNILAIGFIISALFFLCTANYASGFHDSSTFMWWDIIDSYAAMITIPTMYLFFRSMIYEGKFKWTDYIWFIPAIIVGVGTTILYLMMDDDQMISYIQSTFIDTGSVPHDSSIIYRLHYFVGVNLYNLTALLQIVGASIFAIVGLRKYHRRLRDFYSDAEEKSISTDNKILNWFLGTIPLSFALIIPNIGFWKSHSPYTSALFIAWTVVYFALLYYGSQKRHTANNFVQDLQQADRDERKYDTESESSNTDSYKTVDRPMPDEVYKRLAAMMAKLIDEDKIYLKNDLRLDEIAQLMYTNRAYVSKVIKGEYNCSFSDYINGKRIEFSIDLMRLNPAATQDILAEKSGFINAQSYSRTFKKTMGVPPKEWQNRNTHIN